MKSSTLLATLRADVLLIKETVEKEFIDLPQERLRWKESPDRWSILECLEHLNSYSRYYNAQLKKSIEKATHMDNAEVDVKSTWLGAKFINMMRPENIKKQKTFKRMNPVGGKLDQTVLDKFLTNQKELLQLIDEAYLVNPNTTTIPIEFMKLFKLNLGDALQFVVVHEQRHLAQARRVKTKAGQIQETALKV